MLKKNNNVKRNNQYVKLTNQINKDLQLQILSQDLLTFL
jgi:hypothetical protein